MNIFKRTKKENKIVKCHFCRHLVEKDDCRAFTLRRDLCSYGSGFAPTTVTEETLVYYCNLHDEVKYDIKHKKFYDDVKYYKVVPKKEVQVTEKGKIVK